MGSSSAEADGYMCNSLDAGDGYATTQPFQRHTRSEEQDSTLKATGTCIEDKKHEASLLDINTNKNPDIRKKSYSRKMSQRRSTVHAVRHSNIQDEDEIFMYNAKHAIMLFVPVTMCMVLVVATISSVYYYRDTDVYLIYTPFHEKTEDTTTLVWQSTANAVIMLCMIILSTLILLLLYKFRFYRVINSWLMFSSVLLLFFFAYIYLQQLFRAFNIPMDYITVAMLLWNFGVGGIFCLHWKGPLLLQQVYLIVISSFVALTFIKYLPEWTTYTVLGILVIWDLIAVLCPKGPLKILLEIAQQRDEPLFPALIYSSTMLWQIAMADSDQSEQDKKQNLSSKSTESDSHQLPSQSGALPAQGTNAHTPGVTQQLLTGTTSSSASAQLPSSNAQIHSAGLQKPVPTNGGNVSIIEEKSNSKNSMNKPENLRVEGVPLTDNNQVDSVDSQEIPQSSFITRMQDLYGPESGSSTDPPMMGQGKSKTQPSKSVQLAHGHKTGRSRSQYKHSHIDRPKSVSENWEEKGVKLGLGDFIFYGVLVGNTSTKGDWNTTIACFVAIHIGLCFTLLLLAIYRKALPALPISLVFGLVFNFATSLLVKPFMESLASSQVYI